MATTMTVLTVPDISCDHCVRSVTNALTPLVGIADVSVDLPAKQVTVTYDESQIDVATMKDALAEEDYPVTAVAN